MAPDYQKVVGAAQSRRSKVVLAEAEAISTNAAAEAASFKAIASAEADRARAQVNAGARADLFTNQLPAYAAAPSVYINRAYLQAFAKATAPARKYVIVATNAHDVIQFDLQDKFSKDLLDATVPTGK